MVPELRGDHAPCCGDSEVLRARPALGAPDLPGHKGTALVPVPSRVTVPSATYCDRLACRTDLLQSGRKEAEIARPKVCVGGGQVHLGDVSRAAETGVSGPRSQLGSRLWRQGEKTEVRPTVAPETAGGRSPQGATILLSSQNPEASTAPSPAPRQTCTPDPFGTSPSPSR